MGGGGKGGGGADFIVLVLFHFVDSMCAYVAAAIQLGGVASVDN